MGHIEKGWLCLLDEIEEVRQLAAEHPSVYSVDFSINKCKNVVENSSIIIKESILAELMNLMEKVKMKPQHYPVDYTLRLCAAMVAEKAGYVTRCAWTEVLRADPRTKYATRLLECRFHL